MAVTVPIKNSCILVLVLLASFMSRGQNLYQGQVKDKKDGLGLPYCAVGIKGLNVACLSNEDGYFRLKFNPTTDTLTFQALGYRSHSIAALEFLKEPIVFLEPEAKKLEEVTVYANDDRLYELMDRCRKTLLQFKNTESKVYYSLQSSVGTTPVELLECYYNGKFTNARVKELNFKNGRAGLSAVNGRYFVNLDVSKAFTFLDLINPHEKLPSIPFQLTKKQVRKNYQLGLRELSSDQGTIYQITFVPRNDSARFFKGTAWIDQASSQLLKLDLEVNNTSYHPFLPAYEGLSKITTASLKISKTYQLKGDETHLEMIRFNYQLNYTHLHQTALHANNPDTTFEVNARGLMYFYDYGNPFILPRFDYDTDFTDYRKIVSLGYNESFWQNNFQLMYSKRLQKELQYFNRNGKLLNYRSALNLRTEQSNDFVFADTYVPWSATKRISLKKSGIKHDSTVTGEIPTKAYQLAAQIFLDIDPAGDSLRHYSTCLLDVFHTFYNLKEEPYTNCFLNIYFDLCEIQRRQLETEIKGKQSLVEVDALYKKHKLAFEKTSARYLSEVERGKNKNQLKKWNDMVKSQLGIDNMALFAISP